MGSLWNFAGIIMWAVVVGYLVFMVHNIRFRQFKLIIKHHKSFTWNTFLKNLGVFTIGMALLIAAGYLSFFDGANMDNSKRVTLKYKNQPLVLEVTGKGSYFVKIKNTAGYHDEYTFYTKNHKNRVLSNDASVVDSDKRLKLYAKKYNFNYDKLQKYGKENENAYEATVTGTYKDDLRNGLSFRAGKKAGSFTLIRVPSENMILTE